ncbi:MAG: glycosyltransferase [Acidobacteriota bacterium]
MKKRFLVFCDYYLPGYKSGGGMFTVANLIDRFVDRYEFFVVTRNHESKGNREPYTSVKTNAWNKVGNATVFYVSNETMNRTTFARLFAEVAPDAVYLNSAFSMPVITFLNARRKRLIRDVPVILAPCGELSVGALSTKPLKKKAFLKYSKFVDLYRDVTWKASFSAEEDEIRSLMGRDVEVMIAPDLAPRIILPDYSVDQKPAKVPGEGRFVFLSRLTRKKNIEYFLERLEYIKQGKVHFEIIGPIENETYWRQCDAIIKRLGPNVTVKAVGAMHRPEALARLVKSHFFVLPTLGENFGYAFIEALAAGSPLLISENTVWTDVEDRNVGWIRNLSDDEGWKNLIQKCVDMDQPEFDRLSLNARKYAVEWLAQPAHDAATANVLNRALDSADTAAM